MDPQSRRKFYAHPEDRGHWDRYDWKDPNGREGSFPENRGKPRPNQYRQFKRNQSRTDPWEGLELEPDGFWIPDILRNFLRPPAPFLLDICNGDYKNCNEGAL